MSLVSSIESVHTRYIKYANIICDHRRRAALSVIFDWLEQYGLHRDADELEPMTDWMDAECNAACSIDQHKLFLAGRFAQWKFFWTDDCFLRGVSLNN